MSWADWFAGLPGRLRRHPSDAELLAFMDGEVQPRKARRLAAHIAGCPSCSHRLARLKAAVDRLGGLVRHHKLDEYVQLGRRRLQGMLGARDAQALPPVLTERFLGRLAADSASVGSAGVILETLLGVHAAAWASDRRAPGAARGAQ